MQATLLTISELAELHGISSRAIRFYEDKGLLLPQRVGANRVYSYKDSARLKLILRGKRLGFSLEEIREFLDLYNTEIDPALSGQVHYLLTRVRERASLLHQQQDDLILTLEELARIEQECLEQLRLDRNSQPS